MLQQIIDTIKNYVMTPEFGLIAIFAGVSLILFIGLYYTKSILYNRLISQGKTGKFSLSAFLERTSIFFVLFFSLEFILWFMALDASFEKFIDQCFMVAFFMQLATWSEYALTDLALSKFQQHRKAKDLQAAGAFSLIRLAIRVVVWAIALMIILRNFGFDVTALVAGFGISGIAIGLASQKILGDLFASLSIILDRPFAEGDFIVVDSHWGTVEEIGLKSTRIRSLTGEQLICSNTYLLDSRIKNYRRMQERRTSLIYHFSTENKPDKLEEMVEVIRNIFSSKDKVRIDRLGISKVFRDVVYYEVVFWVNSPSYVDTAAVIYQGNIDVMREARKIGMLFPKDYGSVE